MLCLIKFSLKKCKCETNQQLDIVNLQPVGSKLQSKTKYTLLSYNGNDDINILLFIALKSNIHRIKQKNIP